MNKTLIQLLIPLILSFVFLFLLSCSNNLVEIPELNHEVVSDTTNVDEPSEVVEKIESTDDKGCQENNGVWDKKSLYTCYEGVGETSLNLICENNKLIVVMSAPVEGVRDSWEVGIFSFIGVKNQVYKYILGSEKSPTAIILIDVTNKKAVKLHFTEFDYAGNSDFEGDYKKCTGK